MKDTPFLFEKRTKIVATLGPASSDRTTLKAMIEAGLNVVRLNFSHGTQESHAEVIQMVRTLSAETGQAVAIIGDLRGPRIRVGEIEEGQVLLETDQRFTLTPEDCLGNAEKATVSYGKLARDLKPDDHLLLDDGNIHLRVARLTPDDKIECVVVHGGLLSSRRGLNTPGIYLSLPAITQKDLHDIDFAIQQEIDFLALSFVQASSDIQTLKTILAAKSSDIPVIAKIEMSEAVENIENIVTEADGIMVARGDMALEMSFQEIPIAQKRIIAICRQQAVPVITATQMLESMVQANKPTRAEVTDVANAVFDGTDALMLSGETAIGQYPVETVQTMSRIALRAEQAWIDQEVVHLPEIPLRETVGDIISYNSQVAAQNLNVAAIVTYTRSGGTARRTSRFRPRAPIVVLTPKTKTRNQLALSWGVTTVLVDNMLETDSMTQHAVKITRSLGIAQPGEHIIITAGNPSGPPGNTNLLTIEKVE